MKSKSALAVWLGSAFFFCLLAGALAHPGEELEQAWKNRDEGQLIRLHAPTVWEDTINSGRGVYQQIVQKELEFRAQDYRTEGNRAVATFDIYRSGDRVDRVFVYLTDDLVVAYNEREEHAKYFLLGLLPAKVRLDELPGSTELDELGKRYQTEPPAAFRQRLGEAGFVRSHYLAESGRALLVYRSDEDEFSLVLQRVGLDWRPLELQNWPSATALIPSDPGLSACAARMSDLTEQLETYFHFHDQRYPENLDEIAVPISCPVSEKSYRYAVTVDFRWYGLVCEGDSHPIPHYPAASTSAGLRLASTGSGYMACNDKLRSLLPMLEGYKADNGRYPEVLAYLADQPGVHLPRCSEKNKIWAANETDYALMHLPGGLHLFCTSVEHCGEGFAPLQPSYINGLPAKAMFMLKGRGIPPLKTE